MPKDLASHRAGCKGRPTPDHLDNWEIEAGCNARGASTVTLRRLAKAGKIRSRETDRGAEYLVRDVEQWVAASELFGLRGDSVGKAEAAEAGPKLSRLAGRIIGELREKGPLQLTDLALGVRRSAGDVNRALRELMRLRKVRKLYRRGGKRKLFSVTDAEEKTVAGEENTSTKTG